MNKSSNKMKTIDVVAAILVVIGALNWGLIGIANLDVVGAVFGEGSILSRLLYTTVGAAGVFQALQWKAIQRRWLEPAISSV